MNKILDERDREILSNRLTAYASREGLTTGDVIKFKDGKLMRIAYIWRDQEGNPTSVQPCWGGSFFMHKSGGCEMSGGLSSGIDPELFQRTADTAEVEAWFFHHDFAGAGMGRTFSYSARVWYVDHDAPRNYSQSYHLSQVDHEWARERTCGNYHYLFTALSQAAADMLDGKTVAFALCDRDGGYQPVIIKEIVSFAMGTGGDPASGHAERAPRYCGENGNPDGAGSHSLIPSWYKDACADRASIAAALALAFRGHKHFFRLA